MSLRVRAFTTVLILMMGVALLMYVMYTKFEFFRETRDFRKPSTQILTRLSKGQVEDVLENASAHFRSQQLPSRLLDVTTRMNEILGPFKSILKIERSKIGKSLYGETAQLDYSLRYTNAEVEGTLHYIKEGKSDWQLLGFDVDIPESLQASAEMLRLDPTRLAAPSSVIEQTRDIIAALREGRAKSVYDDASSRFKLGTTAERFEATTSAHALELGALKGIHKVVETARNESRSAAAVDLELEFAKKTTPAKLRFILEEGQWRLISYKVVVPEPPMPASLN